LDKRKENSIINDSVYNEKQSAEKPCLPEIDEENIGEYEDILEGNQLKIQNLLVNKFE
jgi:hypothetical protein